MKIRQGITLFLFFVALVSSAGVAAVEAKEGWYPNIVDYKFVKDYAVLPKPKDVLIIDSRPKKRKYDRGHIPGAASIPDSSFDKMTDMLPEKKSTLLIFYCGGVKCMLSHNWVIATSKYTPMAFQTGKNRAAW